MNLDSVPKSSAYEYGTLELIIYLVPFSQRCINVNKIAVTAAGLGLLASGLSTGAEKCTNTFKVFFINTN